MSFYIIEHQRAYGCSPSLDLPVRVMNVESVVVSGLYCLLGGTICANEIGLIVLPNPVLPEYGGYFLTVVIDLGLINLQEISKKCLKRQPFNLTKPYGIFIPENRNSNGVELPNPEVLDIRPIKQS